MKKIIYVLTITLLSFQASAQFDFDVLLDAGSDDVSNYFREYMSPLLEGFAYGMNGGWYNTAKPHKLVGFDLTFGVNLIYIPDERQMFTFNNADFTNIKLADGTSAKLPTMFGKNLNADNIPELRIIDNNEEVLRITALTGLGLEEVNYPLVKSNAIPFPVLQLGLGLIKNTEIKLRLVPKISRNDYEAKMFGLGLMHDFKQWIPGMNTLPFDLAAFFAFSKFNTQYRPNRDQIIELDISSTTFQIIGSKKISVLTVFSGFGLNSINSKFNLKGNFMSPETEMSFNDPVSIKLTHKATPRFSLGTRLKLVIFTLHAEYVLQKYNMFTIGFGFSVR